MTETDCFELDDRALAFVLDHLGSLNTYCSALASRVREDAGRVITAAPVATPIDRLYRFGQGGLLAGNVDVSRRVKVDGGWLTPVETLKPVQARMIADMLRDVPSRSCVVDDVNPVWGDPGRGYDLGATAFGIGEEVYHWFDHRHEAETIGSALQDADTIWHGVCAVSDCPAPVDGPPTKDWLVSHARGARAIFCSAYDGEGFICWRSAQRLTEGTRA